MASEVALVLQHVALAAGQAEFLVGVQHHPQAAPRRLRQFSDPARGFEHRRHTRPVILHAAPDVPRIEVRTEQDELLLGSPGGTPGDLADDVRALRRAGTSGRAGDP